MEVLAPIKRQAGCPLHPKRPKSFFVTRLGYSTCCTALTESGVELRDLAHNATQPKMTHVTNMDQAIFVSSQLEPIPRSTTSGTESDAACSISRRTSVLTVSISVPGTSNTNSSCT